MMTTDRTRRVRRRSTRSLTIQERYAIAAEIAGARLRGEPTDSPEVDERILCALKVLDARQRLNAAMKPAHDAGWHSDTPQIPPPADCIWCAADRSYAIGQQFERDHPEDEIPHMTHQYSARRGQS